MSTPITSKATATIESEPGFDFLRVNSRDAKPRHAGFTEILRGARLANVGKRKAS